jgi:hypothetical protein
MKKIILGLILSLISSPSFAEEAPADQNGWDAESGWAVVDDNGVVQNIIVCTNAVCGENGLFGGVMPSDTPSAGMKIVRQLPAGPDGTHPGGAWGTYDSNTKTFTLDRSCSTCETFNDVYQKGTIKNGVLTHPVIIPGLDTYMLNNPELTIDEAAELLIELLSFNYSQYPEIMAKKSSATLGKKQNTVAKKKSKYRKIELTENLKEFKKVSKTKKVCKIKGNSVLIIKTGICKIDIYKDNKKETTSVKVKK